MVIAIGEAESSKLHAGVTHVLIFQVVGEWEGVHQMVVGDFANLGHEQLLLLFSGKQMMFKCICQSTLWQVHTVAKFA